MKRYSAIEKQVGETPLQAMERFRARHSDLRDVPLTYAGRLDPMASGTLLILIGEECKRQKVYQGMDKEYRFEVLFGFTSDTGDVLGLVDVCEEGRVDEVQLARSARSFVGTHNLPYPIYSSKPVHGVPLFKHAHRGNIKNITIPKKDMRVHRMRYEGVRRIAGNELLDVVVRKIGTLKLDADRREPEADFRRDEIIARWRAVMRGREDEQYAVATFVAVVSSGTYIRALAPEMARTVGSCGLAYHIHRERIGTYYSVAGLGWWGRAF